MASPVKPSARGALLGIAQLERPAKHKLTTCGDVGRNTSGAHGYKLNRDDPGVIYHVILPHFYAPTKIEYLNCDKIEMIHVMLHNHAIITWRYKSYRLATVRYSVLEVTATVEPIENGPGFSLRVLRAGKPRTASIAQGK